MIHVTTSSIMFDINTTAENIRQGLNDGLPEDEHYTIEQARDIARVWIYKLLRDVEREPWHFDGYKHGWHPSIETKAVCACEHFTACKNKPVPHGVFCQECIDECGVA